MTTAKMKHRITRNAKPLQLSVRADGDGTGITWANLGLFLIPVVSGGMNFLTQKLTVDADDDRFDEIMEQVVKCCMRVEPDCEIHLK